MAKKKTARKRAKKKAPLPDFPIKGCARVMGSKGGKISAETRKKKRSGRANKASVAKRRKSKKSQQSLFNIF